jgi:hypothetical protein
MDFRKSVHFIRYLCFVFLFISCTKDPLIPAIPPETLSGFAKSNSFFAKWSRVPNVYYYELDVSSDNFRTFIPGYESLRVDTLDRYAVTDIRAINVTGLIPETSYQFRVRVIVKNKDGEISTSPNSGTFSICTDPPTGTSNYVKDIAAAYSLITGTWKKYSNSATVPTYPTPEPNGITENGWSYCKDQREQITFNSDKTMTVRSPQGITLFSGTYKIDSAISIYGPPQYALVVKISDYFIQDPFYRMTYYDHAFLDLTTDNTLMTFWLYSMGTGVRGVDLSFKRYVREK